MRSPGTTELTTRCGARTTLQPGAHRQERHQQEQVNERAENPFSLFGAPVLTLVSSSVGSWTLGFFGQVLSAGTAPASEWCRPPANIGNDILPDRGTCDTSFLECPESVRPFGANVAAVEANGFQRPGICGVNMLGVEIVIAALSAP